MKCYDVVILSTVFDLWTYGACLLCWKHSPKIPDGMWATGYCGYDWLCGVRIYHRVYIYVYIVPNKTCDNIEPCFQSASVRLCVQKSCLETKRQSNGHGELSFFSLKTCRTKRVQKELYSGRGLAWFRKKQHLMANNHPVFIFLPIPFLFFLECTIPSCLFGNFNGSSGRPGDQNDVWLFIMKEKNVRVAACPPHLPTLGGRWRLYFWVSCYSNWRWFGIVLWWFKWVENPQV